MTVTVARPSPTAAPVIGRGLSYRSRLAVVAHVAMILGMLDPTVLGWHAGHVMPDGHHMPGMQM